MNAATISIGGVGIVESQRLSITIEIDADVRVSAMEAQREVTAWLLDNVGHLAMADQPRLIIGHRTIWRVPVLLSSPTHSPIGPIGHIEVDAHTGQVLEETNTAEKLIHNGRDFVRSVSSTGN